jgi:hemerythrin-like domain-containing protein
MIEIIEILRQEHRNLEKLLGVMEQELGVFDRGDGPDYEVLGAII